MRTPSSRVSRSARLLETKNARTPINSDTTAVAAKSRPTTARALGMRPQCAAAAGVASTTHPSVRPGSPAGGSKPVTGPA